MNIVRKLTLRHLKENKGRTVITTLGICVAIAMITAVFVSVASFMNLFGELSMLEGGNIHATMVVNAEQLEKLKADDRIKNVGIIPLDASGEDAFHLEECVSDRMGTGGIYIGDEVNLSQKTTSQFEGNLPKNENEIAVEKELIEKNNLNWKIGDTVKVPVGTRYIIDEDGEEATFSGSYYTGEQFRTSEIKEFKITAIFNGNLPTIRYSIVRGMSESEKSGEIQATVELEKVNYKSLELIRSMIDDYGIEEYDINTSYLQTKFAIDQNSSLALTIIPMALIILAIIIVASVMLIYNAFGMSLSERVRYLGMLASVGATRSQKRMSVYFEGAVLGLIGIPVGIAAGIAGISITLKAVGDKILSTGMIMGIEDSGYEMRTVVPLWAIIGIVIFSVFTIFISSFIPAKKASAITPIDAIKQNSVVKVKAKKLKSPKIIRSVFGYEGELAYKSLKRNGKKSTMITASIALSVVLFLCVNYFCQIFVQSNGNIQDMPYDISVTVDYDDKDAIAEKFSEVSEIDSFTPCGNSFFTYNNNDELIDGFFVEENLTSAYKNMAKNKMYVFVNYVKDEDFNALCKANGIDERDFYGDTQNALLLNNVSHNEGGSKVFNDDVIGSRIGYTQYGDDQTVTIKNLVDYDKNNALFDLNSKNTISVYVPESTHYKLLFNNEDVDGVPYIWGITAEEHAAAYEKITAIIDENNFSGVYAVDIVDQMQVMNTLVFVLQVFVYGFIALITLVTLANIINTISTGIQLRRKEFAMIKSVGTTPKGFGKMICLESVFYGLKALVFAIPISLLLSFAMNKQLGDSVIPFEINYLMYLCVIAAVFVIIGISMLFSIRQLKNDSIVSTLKDEII